MAVFVNCCPQFWGFRGDLQGRWHLVHVWVAWPKTRPFCILGPFLWAIAHSFGVLGWFTRPMTLSTCFSDMTKNSSFCVYGHFCELFPTILGFRGGLQDPWHLVHVWVAWPKTHSFCVLGPFSWTISHNFGVSSWFTRTITLSTYLRCTTKNLSFCVFRAVFVSYCPLFWGFVDIYKEDDSL
jgi:hypothetical protein